MNEFQIWTKDFVRSKDEFPKHSLGRWQCQKFMTCIFARISFTKSVSVTLHLRVKYAKSSIKIIVECHKNISKLRHCHICEPDAL